MVPDSIPTPDGETLDQLAGVTGVGWTMSAFGFLSSAIGYGNAVVGRLTAEPQALLYVGFAFFLATLGLDRLADAVGGE